MFDALDRDLASSNAGEAMRKVNMTGVPPSSHDTPNEREIEKLKNFTQEIPDRKEFEKAQNPPVLPPHLLQVLILRFLSVKVIFSNPFLFVLIQ